MRNSDLDTWLPAWGTVDDSGDIVSQGIFPDCSSVHAPTEFAGFGVLSVVSVPVTGALDAPERVLASDRIPSLDAPVPRIAARARAFRRKRASVRARALRGACARIVAP